MTGPLFIPKDPSVEGFLDFIEKQPADRKICHKGWDSDCVGEYMHYNGIIYPDILQFIDQALNGLSQALDGFDYINSDGEAVSIETLFQLLDEAKLIESAGISLSTYGHLTIILQAHMVHRVTDNLVV